jgi:LPXTG-motif cell wall-anchored protein
MRLPLLITVASALLLGASVVSAQDQTLTVPLAEQNDSGMSGSAVLTQMGDDLRVVLTLTGTEAGGSHPAHIHSGRCPNPGGVVHPLTNVVNGTSTTTIAGASLADVADGNHAINIHKSAEELSVYTACGDIQVMAAAPTAAPTMAAAGTATSPMMTGATATPATMAPAQLPRTGGPAVPALLWLGAAALGGGLLLRRRPRSG